LIIGISGLTGYRIAKTARSDYCVYGTFNNRFLDLPDCNIHQLDITDNKKLRKLICDIKPDFIINASALHNVDYCEENKEEAYRINTKAVKSLYENSEKLGTKLVHISTDYVFDGKKKKPYSEKDPPLPLSIYGQSKLEGEKILAGSNHLVIRPSVVYGWNPLELSKKKSSSGKDINFALWILTKLHNNEPLKIVNDQFASATLADFLAESILKILEKKKSGLYHVSGLSCESRYDFTIKLAQEFGYDTSLISPVNSSEFKQKAKRPSHSCLNCDKIKEEIGLNPIDTTKSLHIMRKQIESECPRLIASN